MASKVEYMEKRIESILKNREEELTALRNSVTADRQRAEEAGKALEAATAANDIDAYRKAKAEKEMAADLAALHEARTRMLEEKELVSDEEYTSVRDSVLDEVSALVAANNAKAAKLLAELENIADSDYAIIDRANNALLRWQKDIYHDSSLVRNGVIMKHKLTHCELSPVITMSYQIRERSDYRQIIGKKDGNKNE